MIRRRRCSEYRAVNTLTNDAAIRTFNIGFGSIDLYQAVASRRHWWPERVFRWKTVDDLLHVAIGIVLVVVGVFL